MGHETEDAGTRSYAPEFLLRPFLVAVEGLGEHEFPAASRGRALADAWWSYCGAQNHVTFKRFLQMARVRKGTPEPRFGERIVVGGREAFYVSQKGRYVQFVSPDAKTCCNSHPADVRPATHAVTVR